MNFVTVEDLKAALADKSKTAQFVDVRTPAEFAKAHIDGFVNIPMDAPANVWSKLDKNAPTFVLCLSGGRSQMACGAMEDMGFKDLRNVQGGLLTWRGKGGAITS